MKRHKHKWEWQLAKMQSAKYASGMMRFCMCGEISKLVSMGRKLMDKDVRIYVKNRSVFVPDN